MSKNIQKLLKLIELVGHQIQNKTCDMTHLADKMRLSQIKVLKIISLNEKLSMADLATSLKITPASATSLVDGMVKQGWLVRIPDSEDRRKVYIEMSPEKKEIWQKFHLEGMEKMTNYLSVLTEEEQEQFTLILERLVDQNS